MDIETALMTYLLAQSTVTSKVDNRIYFVQAPQSVAKPYMVLTKVSGVREHSHDGSSELAHPRMQFSVFGSSYKSVKEVVAAVRELLDGYTGTMGGAGGVAVGAVFLEDENDFYEDDVELYHTATDYIIWHEE